MGVPEHVAWGRKVGETGKRRSHLAMRAEIGSYINTTWNCTL